MAATLPSSNSPKSGIAFSTPSPIHDDAFFQKLSKTYRLALLSNTDPIHVQHLEANYTFFKFFPTRVYSCSVGASKPIPSSIARLCVRLKSMRKKPSTLMTSQPMSRPLNVLGWEGIQFQSPAQLTSDLKSLGVDLP